MKTKPTHTLLTGEPAYHIYWQKFYEFKVPLSTIMTLDTNSEILVDDSGDLVSYRHDCSNELVGMVNGVGDWHF
jgi:hypothetical protein